MASSTGTRTEQKQPMKCALPNCPVMFVPRAKTAKYCSDRCKRRGHAYRHVLRL